MTHFFTIVARNYLAYAYVLGTSVRAHHPDAVFSIFLVDDVEGRHRAEIEARGHRALLPGEVGMPAYRQFVFKYTITEASTGVKPFVMRYLLRQGATKVVYLDPDILVFRRFDEVLDALDEKAIVLTPHSLSPIPADYFPDDLLSLGAGAYNLGFIAVRAGEVVDAFLAWWAERLEAWCLNAPEMGLFVDQKWVDLVPGYFDDVLILKSRGYNIAYWNLHERTIRQVGAEWRVFPSDEPVAFIHFSGMNIEDLSRISKYGPRSPFDHMGQKRKRRYSLQERPDLIEPFKLYARLVTEAGLARHKAIPYAFERYADGTPISDLERSLFLTSPQWQRRAPDPFATGRGSFQEACRAAGIRSRRRAGGSKSDGSFSARYDPVFAAIRVALRVMLRLMGPSLYERFAKYMRQQFLPVNQGFLLKK
jgi:hypothetical protein